MSTSRKGNQEQIDGNLIHTLFGNESGLLDSYVPFNEKSSSDNQVRRVDLPLALLRRIVLPQRVCNDLPQSHIEVSCTLGAEELAAVLDQVYGQQFGGYDDITYQDMPSGYLAQLHENLQEPRIPDNGRVAPGRLDAAFSLFFEIEGD